MGIGSIISLFGGLGAFLFGMHYMGEGLNLAAGSKMKDLLEKLTRKPIMGFLIGTVVTVVIQSSSATTVMVMGFINAGIMDLAQATGVIMGANIGTTITSILIAMDISALAPLCIAIGALMLLYAKRKRTKYIGQVILGFGLLFQGLKTMSSAMSPLKDSPVFQKFIMNATNPILGFVVGVLLCAILQSSSASVGILQALAMQGLMPLRFAAFLVCGINVGSSTPPLLSALNAKNNAKRAAFIYLIYNLVGAVIFMPIVMITPLTNLLENTIAAPALQVSAFHILFKVVTALVLLPLTNQVVKLTYSFIPKQAHESAFRLEYIDKNLVGNPNVTILQVSKEIGRMVDLIRDSFKTAIDGLATGDLSADGKIRDNEEVLDFLTGEISSYLMQANNRRLPYNVAHFMGSCFQAINDLEQIGDHCVKIWVQNEKNVDAKISYSDQAIQELHTIYGECSQLLEEVMPHFLNRTMTEDLYRDIRSKETDIIRDANIAEAGHLKRVHDGDCTFEQGLTFIEALNSINRIANHLSSIADELLLSSQACSAGYELLLFHKPVLPVTNFRFFTSLFCRLRTSAFSQACSAGYELPLFHKPVLPVTSFVFCHKPKA